MPGVQSFVAQRQQGQLNPSRQLLGAQQRVLVPTTKLEKTNQKPSIQRPNPNLPASLVVAGDSAHLFKQQFADASAVQDGFDTDPEGFDDTAIMSIRESTGGHQGEGDDRNQISGRHDADAANYVAETQVSSRREQEQPHHVQGSRRVNAEDSDDDDDEGSYEESVIGEGNEESDDDESVRHGILQDLNSPRFSQYIQGEASYTAQAAFQSVMTTPAVHSSLALRDAVQQSQKPTNQFTSCENSLNSSGACTGPTAQLSNRHAHKRSMVQNSAVPILKVQGASTEHPSISTQLAAQHRKDSNHHELSQGPSVTSHQTLRPLSRAGVGGAQDIAAMHVPLQTNEENPLSVPNRPLDHGDDASIDWDPDFDERHGMEPTASFDSPQTRNRARDLDYSLDQLSSMTFEQLGNEPFNLASHTVQAFHPQELSSSTLAGKMNYILEGLKDDDAKLVQRRAFFSSLSIEQYEECANLMIRRFGDITSRFADVRQQRRRAAKDFEEEVAKREECVKGKTTVVDKDLGRLKRGGEEVVRGAN